jgi:hypothetical protein
MLLLLFITKIICKNEYFIIEQPKYHFLLARALFIVTDHHDITEILLKVAINTIYCIIQVNVYCTIARNLPWRILDTQINKQ